MQLSTLSPVSYTHLDVYKRQTQESMNAARQMVIVGPDRTDLGRVFLVAIPSPLEHHANKFGEPYPPAKDADSPGKAY